jgi:hypothetical protein
LTTSQEWLSSTTEDNLLWRAPDHAAIGGEQLDCGISLRIERSLVPDVPLAVDQPHPWSEGRGQSEWGGEQTEPDGEVPIRVAHIQSSVPALLAVRAGIARGAIGGATGAELGADGLSVHTKNLQQAPASRSHLGRHAGEAIWPHDREAWGSQPFLLCIYSCGNEKLDRQRCPQE